ncbi:tandem-95 repeat protein [Schumannella soli]|uniref:Tandem-95 repeat protein n=1 Tax=Schumannella soli TaxID=2590779 RepID=A0A506XXW3_9MICO|nr:Ig-like domain-containing protein [Schumannella soli]TPW74127.1 tandem-95 repeat protein [Schumannella soli]
MPALRSIPLSRRARALTAALVAGVVALAAVLVAVTPAHAAGTPLLTDTFTTKTVANPYYVYGGSYTPCLTVTGADSAQKPTSCAVGPNDANGAGALRLTTNTGNLSSYFLYNSPLPSRAGLDIQFTQYQYGGNGADGISFFLTDGQYQLTSVGPVGGSLGYNTRAGVPGLAHALLGIGLDAWGNFPVETNDTRTASTCNQSYIPAKNASGGTDVVKNVIAVRGPAGDVTAAGGSTTGYCLLAPRVQLASIAGAPLATTAAQTPKPATRGTGVPVRITVDPPTVADPKVRVYWNYSAASTTPTIEVPEPAELLAASTFKFGWASSTGGSNDVHEVNALSISTINPIQPGVTPTISAPTTAVAADGVTTSAASAALKFAATDGPATSPISVTVSLDSGAFAGAPTGTRWSCPTPAAGATSLVCTFTPDTSLDVPGATTPALSIPVTSTKSGAVKVTAVVAATNNTVTDANQRTASANAPFAPVAENVSGTGVAAATNPAAMSLTASTTSSATTGSTTYAVATNPTHGTVVVSGSTLKYTPNDGYSGADSFTYTATADGQTSAPATASVTITPSNAATSASTTAGTAVSIDLAALSAGSSLSYATRNPSAGIGQLQVTAAGLATVTPASGFSGDATFQYQVTDSPAGGVSGWKTVTVHVAPTTADVAQTGTLNASGDATLVTAAPVTAAAGTKTFALVAGSASTGAHGTFSIDAATGKVTYVAANGESGVFSVRYTVTADGGASSEHSATFTVRPYADGVSASTPAETSIDLPKPAQKGSDLHWAITTAPTHGTATVDASTGVVHYVPAAGYSGPDSLVLTPTSGTGPNAVAGDPVTASVTVTPIARPVSANTVAAAHPSAVDIAIDATGGTSAVPLSVSATTSDARIASVSVVNGAVRITPVDGASGKLVASYSVSDGTSTATSTATLDVTPVAADAEFSLDNGTGASFGLPAPTGTGPVSYTLVSGTVGTISGSSLVVPTQPAGTSGDRTATYTVTTDGLTSDPATITVHVLPTAQSTTVSTDAGQAVTTDLSALSAGTGLHWTVTQPATGTGSVSVTSAGVATFTPATGYTGTISYTFTPVDAQRNAAAQPATVTVKVVPVLADLAAETTLDQDGVATVSAQPATQPGSPVYELVGGATFGTASIDASTGEITLSVADGHSGVSTVGYRVTAGGQTSATQHAVFTVRPTAQGVSGATTAGTPNGAAVDLPAPAKQGTDVSFAITAGPAHGSATVNATTGVVHYVPADGWSGADSVTLSVTSGTGSSAVAGQAITAAVTTKPVARDVQKDATATVAAQTVSVAADATGTGLSVVPAASADPRVTGVTVANGALQIALAPVASGTIAVDYTVADGTSSSAKATATLHVAPAATGDELAVNSGDSATHQLPAATGTAPTYRLDEGFGDGILATVSDSGALTVHSTEGQSGTFTGSYIVTSDGVDSAPQTITLHVLPIGADTTQTTAAGQDSAPLDLAALSKGTSLHWEITQPAAGGTVTIDQSTGKAVFHPATGFAGTTSWTYTPVDAQGNRAADPLTVDVTVVPTAGDAAATTSLDQHGDAATTATPTGLDSSDGGTKHFQITSGPAKGTATIGATTGTISYTAANGVSGVFTVKYTVTEGGATSAEHTATITVKPYAAGVTGSTTVNQAIELDAPVTIGSQPFTFTVQSGPQHGAVTSLDAATGQVVYTPADGYAGDDAIVLQLADARGASTTVTLTVHVHPVVAPVSESATASTDPQPIRIPLAGTGTIDHYEITTPLAAELGTAVIDGTDLVITPASGVSGQLPVGYRAVAGPGSSNASAPATATLTIAPVAQSGSITVASGGTSSAALGAPVGSGPLTVAVSSPLPVGISSASVDPATGRVTVTTDDDFSGTAQFTYTVTSGSGADAVTSAPATVTVTVDPTLVPVAPGTTTATAPGGSAHPVHATPKATGSGPRTWALGSDVPPASAGTTEIDPVTGEITFTPAPGFSGGVDIPFTVTDGNGVSKSGVFHVDVDPLAAPTAEGGRSRGIAGATQKLTPVSPIGTAPFTYRISTPPTAQQGIATIDPATGQITFVPAAGFVGDAAVFYEVVDASGLASAPAVVVFTVDPAAPAGSDTGLGGGSAVGGASTTRGSGLASLAHTGVDGILPLALGLLGLFAGLAMVLLAVRRRRAEHGQGFGFGRSPAGEEA